MKALRRKWAVGLVILSATLIAATPAFRYWKREYGPLDNSAVLAAWSDWDGPKYNRAECMVRVKVSWPPDQEISWNDLFPTFTRYVYNHEPRALLELGWDRQRNMLLQFSDECPRRYEIARALIHYYERRHGTTITFLVDDAVIQPGPDTMDACGRPWIDCGTPADGWRVQPEAGDGR